MNSSQKKPSLFQKMDEFLFSKINDFKKSEAYEKVDSFIGSLDQETRKFIFPTLGIFVTLLPAFFIIPLLFHNYGLREEVELKKQIAENSLEILALKQELSRAKNSLLDKNSLNSQQEFSKAVIQVAQQLQLKTEDLTLKAFKKDELPGNIQRAMGELEFKDLGLEDLTNFITNLAKRKKIKVIAHMMKKDQTKRTLSGTLKIHHYGKN